MTAQRTVILAMFAMFAGILYQQYKTPDAKVQAPIYKRLWAVGVLTLVLGAAADFVPQIVIPFAVLAVLAFYLGSPQLLANISGKGAVSGSTGSTGKTGKSPSAGLTGGTG